jgi:hypothetical protein
MVQYHLDDSDRVHRMPFSFIVGILRGVGLYKDLNIGLATASGAGAVPRVQIEFVQAAVVKCAPPSSTEKLQGAGKIPDIHMAC